ncbi:hypothetical protein [Haliangium sp.]|uniref:golvesin C-terminal-like domain-containing protein n=1 Tax=Haliangium sp. TaxID=2663208 RepID=UPI003D10B463
MIRACVAGAGLAYAAALGGCAMSSEPDDRPSVFKSAEAAEGSVDYEAVAVEAAADDNTIKVFNPSLEVLGTDFASFGVGGMRNVGAGTIVVSGVSGPVTRAYMYWQGPTRTTDTGANADVLVNGQRVRGTFIGFSDDSCWGFSNSQAYVADVTALVSGDGSYDLSGFGSGTVNTNGASILVFYDDGDAGNDRDVRVYAGNDSNIDFPGDPRGWDVDLVGIEYTDGPASLQLHVADGQVFVDDALRINGVTLVDRGDIFDGFSVPGANSGPAGNGRLWDIVDFDIESFLSPGSNDLNLTTGTASDCLALVTAVVDVPRARRGQPEVIIDNHKHDDVPAGVNVGGTWLEAGSASEHFGATGLFAETGGELDSYRFTPDLEGPGTYRVMVWNNCFSPRASNVPHTIVHEDGVTTVAVDQDCSSGSHGEWLELGTFSFAAGTDGYLEISDAGLPRGSFIGVDGARFLRDDVIVIDTDEPGTSRTGTWVDAAAASENYGLSSLYAHGGVSSTYRFTPDFPSAGVYEVLVWNSCFSTRETRVPHTIVHDGGATTIEVNQDCNTGSHGLFDSLGVFSFATGTGGYLEISNEGLSSDGYVGADAAMFVPAP